MSGARFMGGTLASDPYSAPVSGLNVASRSYYPMCKRKPRKALHPAGLLFLSASLVA